MLAPCSQGLTAWRRELGTTEGRPGHGEGPRPVGQEAQVLLPRAGRPKGLLPAVSFLCEPQPTFQLTQFGLQKSWPTVAQSPQLCRPWEPQATLRRSALCPHLGSTPFCYAGLCWEPFEWLGPVASRLWAGGFDSSQ